MTDTLEAGNLPAPAPVPATPKDPVDWQTPAKWCAAAVLGVSVLGMEIAGYSDRGTYLNYIVLPALGFLGLHTAATNLTNAKGN